MALPGRGFAQSGGKNSTFGGGKGGTKQTRGVTANRKVGGFKWNGLKVAIRSDLGGNTLVGFKGRKAGNPPPLNPGTKHASRNTRFNYRKPAYKGGGN